MYIESLDVVMQASFIWALLVQLSGLIIGYYFLSTYCAQRKNKDLSHRLTSRLHLLIAKASNIAIIRVAMFTFLIYGGLSTLAMTTRLLACAACIFSDTYFSWTALIAAVGLSVLFQCFLGTKGLLIPIGDKLAISINADDQLAFHLTETKPTIHEYADKVVLAVNKLRALGVNDELVCLTWMMVTKLPKYNVAVEALRSRYRTTSQWPTALRPIGVIFATLRSPWKLVSTLKSLPAGKIRPLAEELAQRIEDETDSSIVKLEPRPIKIATLVNAMFVLPHILDDFGGLEAGFIISKKPRGASAASADTADQADQPTAVGAQA